MWNPEYYEYILLELLKYLLVYDNIQLYRYTSQRKVTRS